MAAQPSHEERAMRAWHEADKLDRLRYSQPARLAGDPHESSSAFTGIGPSANGDSPRTHYTLLGVQRNANEQQIRRAYKRLLVAAHPDKGGDPARFQQLKDAFAVLSDPTERLIYDEKLERILESSEVGAGTAGVGAAGHSSCHRGGGVTALVHGQTQGNRQQGQPQRGVTEAEGPAFGSSEMQKATAAIQMLQADSSGCISCRLAAAHLHRACLREAAGQLHHALFDAEEALRLQPADQQAAQLVANLRTSVEGQAQREAAAPAAPSDEEDLL